MSAPHQVVIVGGGFGGLQAALSFKRGNAEVTLVDRRNFHLFQPLLYQVATGALSPANIATPLRRILAGRPNVRVLLGNVADIDPGGKTVVAGGRALPYDSLIVAAGSGHHYFGHEEWAPFAPGLKTLEDATEIRRRVLSAFEKAEAEGDPEKARTWLTFVVVGGGPTGVELAGALGEISRETLKNEFHRIDPARARILLVEGAGRILPPYSEKLSAEAERLLSRLGVSCLRGATVVDIREGTLTVRREGRTETIPSRTVLWAAGIQASPLAGILARRTGVPQDRSGRLAVGPDLTLPGHADIFVIGDMADLHQDSKPLPATAPVAIQEGRYAARFIQARLRGERIPAFHYVHRGEMAVIGRNSAVAEIAGRGFGGYPAWLLWLFVHLLMLVEFENRILVLTQWAWNYFSRDRSARLITGRDGD